MAAFRILLLLLLLSGIGCFVAYAISGKRRYLGFGIRIVQGTVGAGLVFFAVLIVQRLTAGG